MYRYADWAISFRQHYEDQYERALLALAVQRLTSGDAAACLLLSQKVLRLNSWQEQAAELGMRAALALGDRAAALKIYKRLEKDLDHELGIAPQESIRQLFLSIKAG